MNNKTFQRSTLSTKRYRRHGMILMTSFFLALAAGTTVQAGPHIRVTGRIPGNTPDPHSFHADADKFKIKKPMDLAITHVGRHPHRPVILGEEIKVAVTVKNKGVSDSGPFRITLSRCYDSSTVPCRPNHPSDLGQTSFQDCGSLSQGESCTKTFRFFYNQCPGMSYTAWFAVSANPIRHRTWEPNKGNNKLHHPIPIPLRP